MTPALRKAAVLSLVLVALTIIGAVLLLNEPDRDYYTEPGEEPANRPSREEESGPESSGDETGNELAGGTGDATEPAPEPESGEATTKIEAPIRLVLLLLDADGEEPVGNEEFNLRMEGPVTRNLLLRTDSDGFARVTNVPEGEYPALLRHPSYLSDRRVLTIPSEKPTTDPEVVKVLLEKGKSLTGKVIDRRGRAIGGANVTLHTGTSDGPQTRKATSGNDGTFTIGALTVGIWTLTAFHPAYSFAGPLRTEIPAQEDLTIQLGETKQLNVFVENPDATPCEGARIVIRINASPAGGSSMSLGVPTAKTFTDAEGLAVLNNLPDDPSVVVTLSAIHASYTPISKNATIDELERGEFVLRFAARRSLGGIVLDPDGNIVPNIRVSLTGPQNQFVNSISDGTFQFNWRKLKPGKYWLQASAAASGVSKRLQVDLNEEAPLLVELVLEPGTGAISGWVEDAAGQPLGLVPLKLYSEGISIEAVSAPSGDFSFDYLPKATYTLRAGDAKRGQAMLDKLLPGTDDIRLVIGRPGSLRGIIESEGPALGFSLRLQERPGPDARSIPPRTWKYTSQVARFHLRDLSPGTYDLHVLQQGKVIGKLERITIRPGEETGPVGITGLE
jgi:hypothetical protein